MWPQGFGDKGESWYGGWCQWKGIENLDIELEINEDKTVRL